MGQCGCLWVSWLQEEPKEEPPKGALAALLRSEKPEEEKTEEELKKQQQALQEALLNSLPTSESPPEPQKVEAKAGVVGLECC